jgi:hypothetical protein
MADSDISWLLSVTTAGQSSRTHSLPIKPSSQAVVKVNYDFLLVHEGKQSDNKNESRFAVSASRLTQTNQIGQCYAVMLFSNNI